MRDNEYVIDLCRKLSYHDLSILVASDVDVITVRSPLDLLIVIGSNGGTL